MVGESAETVGPPCHRLDIGVIVVVVVADDDDDDDDDDEIFQFRRKSLLVVGCNLFIL